MTTKDWLTDFNNECDKLKSELIDKGIEKMVQSRETDNFANLFQDSINNLSKQVKDFEKHLGKLDDEFSQLSATVSGTSGPSGTTTTCKKVDPVTCEKLKALAKASEVNTRGTATANIPAVGEKPRPTPYLKDKK